MAELSNLHVKITGDSTSAVLASSRLVNALSGMDKQVENVAGSLKTLGPAMDISTRAMLPQFNRFNREIRTSRFHTANLAAQFNDIGVMMASGQSPFILAVQQGTQITQVLQSMGGTARQQFAALAAAFKAMISPTALVTIGLIAGAAALVQWARSAYEAKNGVTDFTKNIEYLEGLIKDIEGNLELHRMSIDKLIATYGSGVPVLRQFNAALLELQIDQAKSRMEEMAIGINSIAEAFAAWPEDFAQDLNLSALGKIEGTFGLIGDEAQRVANLFREFTDADDFEEQSRILIEIYDTLRSYEVPLEKIPSELKRAIEETGTLNRLVARLGVLLSEAAAASGQIGVTEGDPRALVGHPLLPNPEDAGLTKPDRGGGGSRTDPFVADFERLQDHLKSQVQLELDTYNERQALLEEALQRRLITQQEFQQMEAELAKLHQEKMAQLDVWRYGSTLAKTEAFLGDMAGALAAGGEKMLRISKTFAAAEAFVSALRGAAKALELPFPANMAAYAKVLATGMGLVQAIRGVSAGGGNSAPGAASGGGAAASAGNPTYLSFTFTDDFANPESVGRFIVEKMNEAIRNGATIEGLRVS